MDFVTLSETGLRVSRASLGTMTFGAQADEGMAARIIDAALDAGVNFIDTANLYAAGASETILGRLLKGRRDKIVLASKVRYPMGPEPNDAGLSRAAMLKAVDASLRRLQTDRLDIYYLHAPDSDVPIEDTLETMEQLVQAGKVRFPATSNYSSWQVGRIVSTARVMGWKPPLIAQVMYSLVARGIEQEFLPMAKELDVATIVYNPLAGGLLTGKHASGAPAPGSRLGTNQVYRDRYWHEENLQAAAELGRVAKEAGRSLISLALNWIQHHTPVPCVVLGATNAEQLRANLDAMAEGPLPAEAVEACNRVWAKLRGVTPQYNR